MYVSCRDELLEVVTRLVKEKKINEFTVLEAIDAMQQNGTVYTEGTIRTHVTSRCCVNSPKHHPTTFDDYERIGRGIYRIIDSKKFM